MEKKIKGFTLLEVVYALAILSVALLGVYQGQSGTVKMTRRAEFMAQAYALAQKQMTETEILIRKKNFEAIPEEESGDFKDEKLKEFKWIRKLEKINLGCFFPSPPDPESKENVFFGLANRLFSQAVRKIKIIVEWKEGNKKRNVSISQLYIRFQDLRGF